MEIDIDCFKAKNPLLDLTFYVALAITLSLLIPEVLDEWNNRKFDAKALGIALGPFVGWLISHGYVRGKGVEAYGVARAAAIDATASQLNLAAAQTADKAAKRRTRARGSLG